ncbi:MAG: hypothetical protein LBQ63_05145 [Deltaproteobacteria bacterium]|nr:hypothetical protein [Deltaproteobacteria bacterium]
MFHWPPESLLNLTAEDLRFWGNRLKDLKKPG